MLVMLIILKLVASATAKNAEDLMVPKEQSHTIIIPREYSADSFPIYLVQYIVLKISTET